MVTIAQPALPVPFTPEVESGGWQIETAAPGLYELDRDYHSTTDAQDRANANLIAAAPRLYRALAAFVDSIEQGSPSISKAYAYGKETLDQLIEAFDAGG